MLDLIDPNLCSKPFTHEQPAKLPKYSVLPLFDSISDIFLIFRQTPNIESHNEIRREREGCGGEN